MCTHLSLSLSVYIYIYIYTCNNNTNNNNNNNTNSEHDNKALRWLGVARRRAQHLGAGEVVPRIVRLRI